MSEQGQQGAVTGAQATLAPPPQQHHGIRGQSADGGQGIGPNRGVQHGTARLDNPFSWRGAIRRASFSNIFQGINITPNMLFLLLFVGMGLWLWVIYWVRHNEPLANRALGTTNSSVQAHADRRIVDGIRKAVPIRTSPSSRKVFTAGGSSGQVFAQDSGVAQVPYGALPLLPSVQLDQGQYGSAGLQPVAPATWQNSQHSAYHVPVQTADGLRLKTVTHR